MAECNRVTPLGDIVAIEQRGLYLGNRGSIHRDRTIVRRWRGRRWIVCALEHKGWLAPRWEPGRWTPLFFWDEAVALAAGHRPCSLCRHEAFVRWTDAWESATGTRATADPMDRQLHGERTAGTGRGRPTMPWVDLPVGTFVLHDGLPALVTADRVVPWRPASDGYGRAVRRPSAGATEVLTPASTVAVLRHGYVADVHPSAAG